MNSNTSQKVFLVTGGAGFIGTNLCERLVAEGHRVKVVDDLSGGKRERLPESVEFHKLDICEHGALTEVMRGVDVVVHLAALPRVQFSIEHPFEAHQANTTGTLSVLEAARVAQVRRVVYAASSSAYGDQETMPLTEDMPPQPKSPYGLQKYFGEGLMKLWHDIHGLETISLRFFNVYGPKHFDPNGAYALVIGKFVKQRCDGEPMSIMGDGEQTRDFTHVTDIVDGIYRAATRENVGHGEVINLGAGNNTSVNRIAELIGGPTKHFPPRIEPKHTRADNTKAYELLGWKPQVSIEAGIAEIKKLYTLP